MGGGGSSTPSSQPYDLLGGQYASFSGGTPSGINSFGAFQDLGKGIGNATQTYARSVPSSLPQAAGSASVQQPFSIQGQSNQGYPLIPTNSSANGDQSQMIMQLLQQLLGGG